MLDAANALEFERAALLRDQLKKLQADDAPSPSPPPPRAKPRKPSRA